MCFHCLSIALHKLPCFLANRAWRKGNVRHLQRLDIPTRNIIKANCLWNQAVMRHRKQVCFLNSVILINGVAVNCAKDPYGSTMHKGFTFNEFPKLASMQSFNRILHDDNLRIRIMFYALAQVSETLTDKGLRRPTPWIEW